MILKIQPLEQWTARIDENNAIYLDAPDTIDVDFWTENNPDKFYYGENHFLLIEKLIELGAKQVDCPYKIIYV